MAILVAASCLDVNPVRAQDEEEIEVEVTKVSGLPGSTIQWKRGDGEWESLGPGQILKTCDQVKLVRATIKIHRFTCPNRQRWKTLRITKDEKCKFHISAKTPELGGLTTVDPGGFFDLYDGYVRIVDGPSCTTTGHCGTRGATASGVPLGSATTDYAVRVDSAKAITTFYQSPSSSGTLSTRAIVGLDTVTTHALLAGQALRYNTSGQTSVPHVGLMVLPDDGDAATAPGVPIQCFVVVFNPHSVSHTITLQAFLEAIPGWSVSPSSMVVNLGPGANTTRSFLLTPPGGAGANNLLSILATTESADTTEDNIHVTTLTPMVVPLVSPTSAAAIASALLLSLAVAAGVPFKTGRSKSR